MIAMYVFNIVLFVLSDMVRLGDDPTGGYMNRIVFFKVMALLGSLIWISRHRMVLFTTLHILLTLMQWVLISMLSRAHIQESNKKWEQLQKECHDNPHLTQCSNDIN